MAHTPWGQVEKLLDWCCRNGIMRIGLLGGEPTQFRHIGQLVREPQIRGMQMYLAINGLIDRKTLEALLEAKPHHISLHLTPATVNSSRFAAFCLTAGEIARFGVPAALRINLTDEQMDFDTLLDFCHAHTIPEIRVAVPTPNSRRSNDYVVLEELKAFGSVLDRLVQKSASAGIEAILCKPFPICFMREQTARVFLSNDSLSVNCPVHQRDFTNNLMVYPDLSFSACLALNSCTRQSILDFESPREASESYRQTVKALMKIR